MMRVITLHRVALFLSSSFVLIQGCVSLFVFFALISRIYAAGNKSKQQFLSFTNQDELEFRFEILSFWKKMPQSDITKFFSPKAKENRLNISNTSMSPKSPVSGKRKASEVEDEEESSSSSSCKSGILSPDQKKRMLANKLVAKIKVNTRKFPFALHDNIGQSWFAALEPEFGKPYFKGLNDFLEKERSSSVKIFPPHDKVIV